MENTIKNSKYLPSIDNDKQRVTEIMIDDEGNEILINLK